MMITVMPSPGREVNLRNRMRYYLLLLLLLTACVKQSPEPEAESLPTAPTPEPPPPVAIAEAQASGQALPYEFIAAGNGTGLWRCDRRTGKVSYCTMAEPIWHSVREDTGPGSATQVEETNHDGVSSSEVLQKTNKTEARK